MEYYEDVDFKEFDKKEECMNETKTPWDKIKEFCSNNHNKVMVAGGLLIGLICYKNGYKKGHKIGMDDGSQQFCKELVASVMTQNADIVKF